MDALVLEEGLEEELLAIINWMKRQITYLEICTL